MISRKFLQSSVIYSFVGALPYASGLILIPLFIQYLTPAQFGANAIYLTLLYFIQILSTFGLDNYIGINYFDYKDNAERLKEFIGNVLLALMILGGFIFISVLCFGNFIFTLVYDKENFEFYPFGLITVLSAIFNGFFKSYSSLLVNQQKATLFFWLNLSNFILTIAASVTLIYAYPYTLYGPTLGRLIPAVISASLSVLLMLYFHGFSYNFSFFRGMFNYCYPLLFYALLLWVVNYIDRNIIYKIMKDPTYVGIYDVIVKITLVIDMLQIGLANTMHPKIFTIWKDKNLKESTPEVNRYYNAFTGVTLLIIPLFDLVVPLVVPLFISKQIYLDSFEFIGILSLGFATKGWFYMFLAPLFFFKKTKVLPKVFAFSALFEIVFGIILVHYFQLWGAVIAGFLVKFLQGILLYFESRKVFSFRFNRWKIVFLPLIFIFMVVICQLFMTRGSQVWFFLFQFLITSGLVYITYRKELMTLLRQMTGRN